MAGNIMSIKQTNVYYMVPMFKQLGQSYNKMSLPPQPQAEVQVAVMLCQLSSVASLATYLICYKTILKTKATIHSSNTNFMEIFS